MFILRWFDFYGFPSQDARSARNDAPPSAPCHVPRYCRSTETRARTDAIDSLTAKQRAHLRALAHPLKPILHVGADGVTDAVIESVREAFNTRELLKVKVHESAPVDVDPAAAAIAAAIDDAHVAQTIGRTMVLYRPFPGDPQIRLPR